MERKISAPYDFHAINSILELPFSQVQEKINLPAASIIGIVSEVSRMDVGRNEEVLRRAVI